jgi:soluble lytic murein transglycosylase
MKHIILSLATVTIFIAHFEKNSNARIVESPHVIRIEVERTADFDLAFEALLNTESGKRQFDKRGNPLKSSAGAIGIAQVLPTTAPEACALAGFRFNKHKFYNDAAYNRACGEAYFRKQLADFNGNYALAYSAYNAGGGATRRALERCGGGWLSCMPLETRNYVPKNMRAFKQAQKRALKAQRNILAAL